MMSFRKWDELYTIYKEHFDLEEKMKQNKVFYKDIENSLQETEMPIAF